MRHRTHSHVHTKRSRSVTKGATLQQRHGTSASDVQLEVQVLFVFRRVIVVVTTTIFACDASHNGGQGQETADTQRNDGKNVPLDSRAVRGCAGGSASPTLSSRRRSGSSSECMDVAVGRLLPPMGTSSSSSELSRRTRSRSSINVDNTVGDCAIDLPKTKRAPAFEDRQAGDSCHGQRHSVTINVTHTA